MYLSYFGLRVREPRRSTEFYERNFGLKPVEPIDWTKFSPSEPWTTVLRDPHSGQRLELNYYPPGNPYAVPYAPGEELDHIGFRVDDLDAALKSLESQGYPPEKMAHYDGRIQEGPTLRVAYLRGPDGMQIELFQARDGKPVAYDPDQY